VPAAAEIRTARLVLRRWRPSDRAPFAELNSDPEVIEHLPGPMTRAESDAFLDRIDAHWDEHGYGRWAVDVPGEAEMIGFIGLTVPQFHPLDEIGWRLARPFWGRGLATEGAKAVLGEAFGRLGREEVVSFTVPANLRSTRVMERLGMTHDPADDFDHPYFPEGHRLRRHVLYRLTRAGWERSR
jgi:RimJ/RimL family protein N-acetyltransferase